MQFVDFLKPELAILPVILYALGIAIKRSNCKDWKIPFILGGVGIALAVIFLFSISGSLADARSIASLVFAGLTQGALSAAVAVYANQAYKQATEGRKQDNAAIKL